MSANSGSLNSSSIVFRFHDFIEKDVAVFCVSRMINPENMEPELRETENVNGNVCDLLSSC